MKWLTNYVWISPARLTGEITKYYDSNIGLALPNGDFLTERSGRYLTKVDAETGSTENLYDFGSWTPGFHPYLLTQNGHLLVHQIDNWGGDNNKWFRSTNTDFTNFAEINVNEGYFRALSRHHIAEGNGMILYGDYHVGAADDANEPEVKIRKSIDGGLTWTPSFVFPKRGINENPENYSEDAITHIHCIEWDPYEELFWVGTGDPDSASRLYKTSDGENLELVGRGYYDGYGGDDGQVWRVTSIQFFPDFVMWGMDGFLNPGIIDGYSGNYIVRYDRKKKTYELLHKTAGYMFYSGATDLQGGGRVALFNNNGAPSTIYASQGGGVQELYEFATNYRITFVPLENKVLFNGGNNLPKPDAEGNIRSAVLNFREKPTLYKFIN